VQRGPHRSGAGVPAVRESRPGEGGQAPLRASRAGSRLQGAPHRGRTRPLLKVVGEGRQVRDTVAPDDGGTDQEIS
jgi:hypothetical protein